HLTTEQGELRREQVLLTPVQDEGGVTRAAGRLLAQMAIPAPVTSLHLLIEGLEPPAAQNLELAGLRPACQAPGARCQVKAGPFLPGTRVPAAEEAHLALLRPREHLAPGTRVERVQQALATRYGP